MGNYKMCVEFLGNTIQAETEDRKVCLNDVFIAGNAERLACGKPALQMASFLASKTLSDYVEAAELEWGLTCGSLIRKEGSGKRTRTYVHISVAILAAETMSPRFHAYIHRVFVEGKLLEFRERGGTEFKTLNAAIDAFLPGREGKSNKGIFIQVAVKLRAKILGPDATTASWNTATVDQTHTRYDLEYKLSEMIRLGLIRDYDHLKDVIERL